MPHQKCTSALHCCSCNRKNDKPIATIKKGETRWTGQT
ncbi:hypothetical protein B4119_2167 [Parageobacillus caldoxylosilyticus]|uniref:Uncharacterized protein n=1 Tax=Saccharococcus caldoxylosilyticus TaxID=81408 RepID=A0A150LUN9_9BACL|nr:hypothetical protein B4119_2167 [Parageobacillus caldoxylosilyticus]